MPWENAVPTRTTSTKIKDEEEVGQCKGCTSKAQLAHTGKSARKYDKRSYITDIKRRQLRQDDKKWEAK